MQVFVNWVATAIKLFPVFKAFLWGHARKICVLFRIAIAKTLWYCVALTRRDEHGKTKTRR